MEKCTGGKTTKTDQDVRIGVDASAFAKQAKIFSTGVRAGLFFLNVLRFYCATTLGISTLCTAPRNRD
jgi:hypothetical protein